MELKVKRLHPNAVLPARTTEGAAGLDLTAISEEVTFVHNVPTVKYGTGIAVEIPKGHVGLLFARSSVATTKTLILANSVGVLDQDYRGEISFVFKDLVTIRGKKYKPGERIGQLVIVPCPVIEIKEVNELNDTKRGTGSYGSTGA